MLPVAVLAGGLGSRLRGAVADDVPKALVPVAGRPFLDHKLTGLAAAGTERVVLLVGHRGEAIRDRVGDGTRYGLRVEYVEDGPRLCGTGGAVGRALPVLGDAFWVTYGDTLLQVDLAAAEWAFLASPALALMTVLHNQDRYEPSNAVVRDGLVLAYGKDPVPPLAEHIDYGMLAFRRTAFAAVAGAEPPFDLVDVLHPLVAARRVAAFTVTERFHDVGTVDALRETETFLGGNGLGGEGARW